MEEASAWPDMVLVELFANLPVEDILHCGLICKYWHATSRLPLLWERLWKRDFERITRRRWKNILKQQHESDAFFRYTETNCGRRDNRKELSWPEFLDKELERAATHFEAKGVRDAGPYIQLYLWNHPYERLSWQTKWQLDSRLDKEATLKLFGHLKGVVQCSSTINHRDMKSGAPFHQGKHRWRVLVEGLDDAYWVAVGVGREEASLFSYSGGQTMGFASNGVILGVAGEDRTGRLANWDNGDIVTVTLDCDEHTLSLARNGKHLHTMRNLPVMPLWPWVNMYNPGASLLLLD